MGGFQLLFLGHFFVFFAPVLEGLFTLFQHVVPFPEKNKQNSRHDKGNYQVDLTCIYFTTVIVDNKSEHEQIFARERQLRTNATWCFCYI